MRLDHITPRFFGVFTETQRNFSTSIARVREHTLLRPNLMLRPRSQRDAKRLLSDYSSVVPPDPIPNSEVKRARADGSVA